MSSRSLERSGGVLGRGIGASRAGWDVATSSAGATSSNSASGCEVCAGDSGHSAGRRPVFSRVLSSSSSLSESVKPLSEAEPGEEVAGAPPRSLWGGAARLETGRGAVQTQQEAAGQQLEHGLS